VKQKYINGKTNYQTPRLEEFEDTKGIMGTTQWPKGQTTIYKTYT
jgi:hypothetical protein